MDTTSAEISGKIRSAIKAKLEELGAYVDEELPDYIMVMIANKKSKEQMSEDLGLFLGKNANVFTDWLHEILARLKSLGRNMKSEGTKAEDKPKKYSSTSASSKERDKKEKVKPSKKEKEERKPKKTEEPKKLKVPKEEKVKSVEESEKVKSVEEPTVQKDFKSEVGDEGANVVEDEEHVNVLLDKAGDDLDLQMEAAANKATESIRNKAKTLPVENERVAKDKQGNKRRIRGPSASPPKHTKEIARVRPIKREQLTPPPPKEPRSSVGSTVQIVSGSKRPEGEQIKPALFLKALNQAQRSVEVKSETVALKEKEEKGEKGKKRKVDKGVAEDGEVSDNGSRRKHKKRKKDKKERKRKRVVKESTPDEVQSKPPSRKVEVRGEDKAGGKVEIQDALFVDVVSPDDAHPKSVTRFVVTLEGLEDSLRNKLDRKVAEADVVPSKEQAHVFKDVSSTKGDSKTSVKKPKLKLKWKKPPTPAPSPSPEPVQEEEEPPAPGTEQIDAGPMKCEDPEDPAQLQDSPMAVSISRVAINLEDEEDFEDEEPVVLGQDGNYVSNKVVLADDSLGPAQVVQPDYGSVESTPTSSARSQCKFWPACKNEQCPFHHPSSLPPTKTRTPCRTFPNCKFAEKCLYTHPHCRYDPFCAKPACPYSHSKRPTRATSGGTMKQSFPPLPVSCRFGSTCTNKVCPFNHPTKCKFGNACTRPGCSFAHTPPRGGPRAMPPLAGASKFKWKSGNE